MSPYGMQVCEGCYQFPCRCEEAEAERELSDLLGPGEVCRVLSISRATLMRYRRREDFPKPFVVLEIGPVWLASDIADWRR